MDSLNDIGKFAPDYLLQEQIGIETGTTPEFMPYETPPIFYPANNDPIIKDEIVITPEPSQPINQPEVITENGQTTAILPPQHDNKKILMIGGAIVLLYLLFKK